MRNFLHLGVICALAGWLSVGTRAQAAETNPAATKPAPVAPAAVTNASVVDTNAFVSTFDAKARDPFYPHSSRASIESSPDGSGDVASPTVILVLKGISGNAKRRSAIINDHTFMVGDESEVPISGGRIRLHCHEIRADSVVISLGSSPEKTELRMPLRY